MPMSRPAVFIDLHVHSHYSDGALSPESLIARAEANGLGAIALADHDSVAGIMEAVDAGKKRGVQVIPAVELSVQFGTWSDVHLLGYGYELLNPEFVSRLNDFREHRERRNELILERVNQKLAGKGLATIGLEDVLEHAHGSLGRPHIARTLVAKGHVTTIEEAFQDYLIPCDVPKKYWPIDDAITCLARIGAVSVLAHPTSVTKDRHHLRSMLSTLRDLGLEGVEVYNNMALSEEMEFLRKLAGELGLLMSAGSDYHGIEEGIEMGRGRGGIRFSDMLLTPLWQRLTNGRLSSCPCTPCN